MQGHGMLFWQPKEIGGGPSLSWPALPAELADELLPDLDDIRISAAKFPSRTALGADSTHPKHLGIVCDQGLMCLRQIWRLMLLNGTVPMQCAALLVVLLPKPTGGTRPIGLFPGVVRLFTKAANYANRWW